MDKVKLQEEFTNLRKRCRNLEGALRDAASKAREIEDEAHRINKSLIDSAPNKIAYVIDELKSVSDGIMISVDILHKASRTSFSME